MQFLWNRATSCIFLGVILQSFCSIKLVWLNALLPSISGERIGLSHGAAFVCAWAVVTFFSRVTGAYTLGKYAEAKGFFAAQKVLVLGYICTTFLFFLCCLYANYTYQIRWVVLLVTYFNAFLFPATLVLPAMYLMKIYNAESHAKISMLMILASVLGYTLSSTLSIKFNPHVMSGIICGGSFLCGFLYYMGKNSILGLEESHVKEPQKYSPISSGYRARILALLVGGVCGAGMTHNYFFIEPYLLNVTVVNLNRSKWGYISFYIALVVFLILARKVCAYVNSTKLLFRSLIGTLLVAAALNVIDVSSAHAYIIYQVTFAFFFAGFLAPSLAIVFSLFQNDRPFFNGVFWYYSGLSFSYLVGYFLSKELGIFTHYFLLVSPLVLMGVPCMAALRSKLLTIRSSLQQ